MTRVEPAQDLGDATADEHPHFPMADRGPLPWASALRAIVHSAAVTFGLLLHRRTHLPRTMVGSRLHFADGSSARVFRETTVDDVSDEQRCILVVTFRLRLLRGRWHRLFLWECILNTPMFVGFSGFASKLWIDHDEHDNYRGLYEWSDSARAERYARSLMRVLQLVCRPGSVRYVVLPGLRRRELFDDPSVLRAFDDAGDAWWRVVGDPTPTHGPQRVARSAAARTAEGPPPDAVELWSCTRC
jgi:hypothetical protein